MREVFNPPLCDEDCNHCVLLRNENGRMVTRILNDLLKEFGNKVYEIVQHRCPNMTCCWDCHIDDFCHIEGCELDSEQDPE